MKISIDVLNAAMSMISVASNDPTRYTIMGVRIVATKDVVTLKATDGSMGMIRTFTGVDFPQGEYVLHKDQITALKRILKEAKGADTLDGDLIGKDLRIGLGLGSQIVLEGPTSEYAPLEQVIPKAVDNAVSIAFDADKLAALADALRNTKSAFVRIEFNAHNPTAPMLVYGPNGVAVLMPCRDDVAKAIAQANAEKESNNAS